MDPLRLLRDLAALATGWPTLIAEAPDEAAALAALAVLERLLGPLPQAELVEPWADEAWTLRVPLPTLQPEDLAPLAEAMPCPWELAPTEPPGVRHALDEGLLVEEVRTVDGLRLATRFDPLDGRAPPLDLLTGPLDPALAALEADLAAAVRDAGRVLEGDRGVDTVTPVLHRESGRLGLALDLHPHPDPLPDALLAGLAAVARDHAGAPLRLAPDLLHQPRAGTRLIAWLVAPPGPRWPQDASPPGDPSLATLTGLLEAVEVVRVGPVEPALPVAEAHGLFGGPPRWRTVAGVPRFAASWRVDLPADPVAVAAAVEALAALPSTQAVAVLPGEPVGLGDAWPVLTAHHHRVAGRWFQRLRDGLVDRDRLPVVGERPEDGLSRRLSRATSATIRPVHDSVGRLGWELTLPARAVRDPGLDETLEPIVRALPPEVAPLSWFALRDDRLVVQLWEREGPSGVRRWEGTAATR